MDRRVFRNQSDSELVKTKKTYDNIYFLLAIMFLIFIFVLIFYLYQQKFNWDKDIIAIFISTLGILGTFTAASAAAISARLAKKSIVKQELQFQKTIEPLLVPNIPKFKLEDSLRFLSFLFSRWDSKTSLEDRIKGIEISVLNIGNGIAKDIEIKYEILNINQVMESYSEVAEESILSDFELSVETESNSPFSKTIFLGSTSPDFGYMSQSANNFPIQRIPFLTKEAGKVITLEFPYAFNILSNLWSYASVRGINIVKPRLKLMISCKDLSNRVYNFNYIIYVLKTESMNFSSQNEYIEITLAIENF